MSKNPFSKEKGFTEKGLRSKLFFKKKFDQKKTCFFAIFQASL